ncbi:hypothetical protein SCLCIDRAFT_1222464 [Scleroderma citrinum Foug A]|uniref:Uncharacterized protein n=1 Tax=Scleroderma citrinum Foug A TaxID=1036808 RepID=A0A0C3DBP5_9AGAM|nr:hypothetical protein SCLCIDRAFT_1222464 [Scleroderma citrinum Foug A]
MQTEASIKVGKERYWKTIFAGTMFLQRSICLRIVHDDIIGLWNFRDDDNLLLSKEFREIMMNLVDLLYRPLDRFPRLPQQGEMTSSMQTGVPVALVAPIKLVKWAHNAYTRRPEVQQIFMAYITDLTNVLDALYTLVTRRSDDNLNIRTVKIALMAYYKSMKRKEVHARIRKCSGIIFGSNGVISEIESLVRER